MSSESKEIITPIIPSNNTERSEEVQSIVDRMPTKGATYVAAAVAVLVIVTFILSCVISYSDTVDGSISLTGNRAPIRLVANASGQLHLFHADGDTIAQGDHIASIQNVADVKQILKLEKYLNLPFSGNEYEVIEPLKEGMGEICDVFSRYLLALSIYNQHLHTDLYTTEIQNLKNQIASDRSILSHINSGKKIRRKILELSSKELSKDSLLLTHKAITDQELNQKRTSFLNDSESYWNTESNCATVQARIDKNEFDIKRLQVEEKETGEKLLADLRGKRSDLYNQILVWKSKYLLISPIDGKLEYLGFWRDHSFIQAGEEVVTIIPKQQKLFGEVRVPSEGAGKIKVGQSVNVKVNNYPFDEYGLLKGTIIKVSQIPSIVSTKDGKADSYLAIVSFQNGAITNYGVSLNIDFESKGTAEIITKDKKLIERLFDNLKSLGTK